MANMEKQANRVCGFFYKKNSVDKVFEIKKVSCSMEFADELRVKKELLRLGKVVDIHSLVENGDKVTLYLLEKEWDFSVDTFQEKYAKYKRVDKVHISGEELMQEYMKMFFTTMMMTMKKRYDALEKLHWDLEDSLRKVQKHGLDFRGEDRVGKMLTLMGLQKEWEEVGNDIKMLEDLFRNLARISDDIMIHLNE